MTTPTPTALDPQAVNLAKAIRQSESGGNFTVAGKSGEYGAYQYTEPTWAKDSAAAGVNVPLKQATPEQQNQVAYTKIKALKDSGLNVGQIASVWNAGEGEQDAYTGKFSNGQPSVGVNKYGVKFDVPAYAKSVATTYQTLKNGGQAGADPNNPSSTANTDTPITPVTPDQQSAPQGLGQEIMGGLGSLAKGAANLFLGPAESLGTHLGQLAAGGTANIAGMLGDTDLQQKINSKLQQPISTLTGGTVQPLKGGLGGAEQIGGDALQTGLLAAGPEIGGIESLGGRLAANAALGAGFGAGNAMSNSGNATDVGTGALTGGLVGGAVGGAGELLSKAASYLPQRIARSFIPGINQDTAQYAVDQGLGTPAKMLTQSNASLSSIGSSIGSAVKAAEEGANIPSGQDLFGSIAQMFPDSGLTAEDIAAKIKSLVPLKSNIVDKIMSGNATLSELQNLNSALGSSTFKTVFDDPTVKAGKEVGSAAYHSLSDIIKGHLSPQDAALYDEYSKESSLNAALKKAVRSGQKAKMFTLRDLVALTSGFGAGSMFGAGPVGAAIGYAGEKALNSPGLNMGVGGLLSKFASPTAQAIGQGVKGPLIRGGVGLLSSPANQKKQ